ncbi:MAG: hypothetical protein OEV73_08435 [Desulfobulbaceae bacterium]|nr:hypothetical protein [Desulfobulbaceae bacterium]
MTDQKGKHEAWEYEFLEFDNTKPVSPPLRLNEDVLAVVRRDLRPAIWKIFAKLSVTQAICATITLFFCPQFTIGFAAHDHLASLIPHSDGPGFMVVCGILFLGSGALIAPLFLTQAEARAMDYSAALLYFPIAALLAVISFYAMGSDINLPNALPWFAGGTLGSLTCFIFTTRLRVGCEIVKRGPLRL